MTDLSSLENDLRALDAITQRDMQFALANDTAGMMSQWADDIVLLQPDGSIVRGRSTIAETMRGLEVVVEILDSVIEMQEVRVLGDYAYQWGIYRWAMRPRAGGDTARASGTIMRILQRQKDGSWKIYRGISTVDPLSAPASS